MTTHAVTTPLTQADGALPGHAVRPRPAPGRPVRHRAPGSGGGLLVSEIFGPTFQGEGASVGQLAAFVRLGRCTLDCSWCDTAWTWDDAHFDLGGELRPMSEEQIWAAVRGIPARLLVITGGEPLIWQKRLVWLADMCRSTGRRVEIETNGTIAPRRGLIHNAVTFNVGLKLANSGVDEYRRLRPYAIRQLVTAGRAAWKFVVTGPSDLAEIAELEQVYGLAPIWVMPEGTSAAVVLARMRDLADGVLARGWNLTPRLHTLLWGDTRGR
jgi:7-carboxy-7-deazaguanine synthase